MAALAPPLVRRAVVSLSVGQRGTHGQFLRTPQRVEDAGGALDRAQLLVYRHRNRALPRAWRLRASSFHDPALARAGLEVEELATHVAAHEVVDLGGGRDHAP